MNSKLKNTLIIGLMSAITATSAQASIVGGTVTVIAPLPAVFDNSYQTNMLTGFDEKQDFTLTQDLSVNYLASTNAAGTISSGTLLDSHYFFLDPTTLIDDSTWTIIFDQPIAGVIFSTDLVTQSDYLGAVGTTYPGPFEKRGFEEPFDYVSLVDAYTLQVTLHATVPGDWFRVVTVSSVPVPAAVWLFGSGLLGLVGVARRR